MEQIVPRHAAERRGYAGNEIVLASCRVSNGEFPVWNSSAVAAQFTRGRAPSTL